MHAVIIGDTANLERFQVRPSGKSRMTSPDDATFLIDELTRHQEAYRSAGRFAKDEHRKQMLELFERAIEQLQPNAESSQ